MTFAFPDIFYVDENNVLRSVQRLKSEDDGDLSQSSMTVYDVEVVIVDTGSPSPLTSSNQVVKIIILKESKYDPVLMPHNIIIRTTKG